MRLHCAEVFSVASAPREQSESGTLSDVGAGRPPPAVVKALVVDERVEGFILERFSDSGELLGTTQHDTMDDAMWQANSEFAIGDWRSCPEDVDPVEYVRTQSKV